jgi:HK97 family phage prohead protease/HK97 family phage major capsid protein
MSEMITREFQARLDATEERTIIGLAVPYGQEIELTGKLKERFEPGAIDTVENVKLFYGHEEPIGKVIEGRDTPEGYEIVAKISDTPRGNEVYTLLQDDVLNRFSVGFFPVVDRQEGQTIVRELVDLKEVSVVPFPAFEGAKITEVRSEVELDEPEATDDTPIETESETMSENIELDVRSVQDEVAELRRVIESGKAVEMATPATHKFRSQGEFAKALLNGDEDAKQLARDASTSADAAVLPPFVGYLDTLINNSRPTLSAFTRGALPTSGLSVEYIQIDNNTLAVGEQDPENEALAFGNLSFEVMPADVKTYGGYTSFSRQYVERATINTLDQVFQGLTIAYANASNKVVVDAISALNYAGKTFQANTNASTVAKGIAEGSAYIFEATGLRPNVIVAGVTAYVNLVSIGATDGRLNFATTGDNFNMVGNANIPGLSGSLFGVPIIVDPQLNDVYCFLANSAAVTSWESAGAPVRLTQGDVTTLEDSVSVYGYMAVAVQRPGAIVSLDTVA